MGTIHRNPTEESFIIWLSNYPESFHPLDMQRFYTFVKNAISYHSKRWFNKDYFESQIRLHVPMFDDNNINYFYERLLICRDYHASFKTPLIDSRGDKWRVRKVINHKIKDTPIDDINHYFSNNMLKGHRKRAENKDL
jgi:hypothetical protein